MQPTTPYSPTVNSLWEGFPGMANQETGFRTDILDKGDAFILIAELSGFTKDNIRITVTPEELTITASRDIPPEDGDKLIRRERKTGVHIRRFSLSGIDTRGITAHCADGILTLTLPKQIPEKDGDTQQIPVE